MAFIPAAVYGIVSLIGTGISAYGMHQQGQAAKKQANYEAAVVRSNAMTQQMDARANEQTAKVNADSARLEGAEAERRSRNKSRRAAAKFTANLSRQGLDVGSVSLNDSLKSFNTLNRSEELSIRNQTAGRTRQARYAGRNALTSGIRGLELGNTRSQLLVASGANQARSATIGAIGTGLSGFAKWGANYGT